MKVLVIGCGVSGLTCGLRLLEEGHDVELWARELPPHTTSNVAAAFWYPYKAFPESEVTRWARVSYQRFAELAGEPRTGVTMRRSLELLREPAEDPWWAVAVPDFRHARPDELTAGYADGFVFSAPVMDTRVYLPYLVERIRERGAGIEQRTVATLDEALTRCDVVINCTGLGARELANDPEVFPIRGQIVHVEDPGIERVVLDEHDAAGITYVVPRGTDCVLGGTAELERGDTDVDDAQTQAIVERCRRLVPELGRARILGVSVGLRPGRNAVRVEAERPAPGKLVVHDYGHGGAGVTLSWACAEDVVSLVAACQGAG